MRVVSRSEFDSIVAKLSAPGEYGTDTETTGLSESDQLFSVIIADAEESFYFNFNQHPDHLGNFPPEDVRLPRQWIARLAPIFANKESTHYINNAKFDMRMLAKEGITFDCRIVCTEATGRVQRNNYLTYSLASQAPRHLGEKKDESVDLYIRKHKLSTKTRVPGKKKQLERKHFELVPFDIITQYGGHDAYLHRKLGQHLAAKVREDVGLRAVAENEWRLTKTCFRMERLGVKIDRRYTEEALAYESSLLERAKSAFKDLTGRTYDGSKKLLIDVFTAAGERIPKTLKGNDSLTDTVLESFTTPAAKAVQQIRTHEKLIGTYYSSFLSVATDEDLIHADIRQGGTETGRFSYRDPNLQNVPKEDEEPEILRPYPVRGCFVPRPGYCFVMIDYSQQEYRMMFDYAGQKDIIDAIMSGVDAHQATGDILGISRKKAKNTNFAYLYGSGIPTLAKTAGVTEFEARRLKNLYGQKFPYVDAFVQRVIAVGRARGFVRNWLGRQCHIANREWAYILPNHLIQGGCADVVKLTMNKIDDYLADKKSRMVLQVHDEILFEIHQSELAIVPHLKAIMESIYPPRNGMKLEASVEYSWKSWAARDKVKGFPKCPSTIGDNQAS